MFVVTVEIDLKPGQASAFLPLIRENARLSLSTEPGCHQFDICHDPDRPDTVFLYERYEDGAAFDAHLNSAHFLAFDRETAAMMANKTVRTYRSHWA